MDFDQNSDRAERRARKKAQASTFRSNRRSTNGSLKGSTMRLIVLDVDLRGQRVRLIHDYTVAQNSLLLTLSILVPIRVLLGHLDSCRLRHDDRVDVQYRNSSASSVLDGPKLGG